MSDIPTSGAISLNQMHTEVGGSSGTIASINDADIRALISKGSGATMSFNEWYGASSSLDSTTVTVGYRPAVHISYAGPWYGFLAGSSTGSASKTSVAWRSGASYTGLYGTQPGYLSGKWLMYVEINNGGGYGNSGWTSVTIDGTTYNRSAMTYFSHSGGMGWNIHTNYVAPYGSTTGATKSVVFN